MNTEKAKWSQNAAEEQDGNTSGCSQIERDKEGIQRE